MEEPDLVFLEEIKDAIVVLGDDFSLRASICLDRARSLITMPARRTNGPHVVPMTARAPSMECSRCWCRCRPAPACRPGATSHRRRRSSNRAGHSGSRRHSHRGLHRSRQRRMVQPSRQRSLQVQQHSRRIFEGFLDRDQRQHRFAAVDDPMIVGLGEIVHRPYDDLSVFDDCAFFGRMDAQYRRLRRVDRCRQYRANIPPLLMVGAAGQVRPTACRPARLPNSAILARSRTTSSQSRRSAPPPAGLPTAMPMSK